jgi:hypothetical protein
LQRRWTSGGPRCLRLWPPKSRCNNFDSSFHMLQHGGMLVLKRRGMSALLLVRHLLASYSSANQVKPGPSVPRSPMSDSSARRGLPE